MNENVDTLRKREAELAGYSGEFEVVGSHKLRDELSARPKPTLLLKTQIPTLDRYLDGFELGELTVVTGPTKGGKTLLCQTFTEAFTRQGHDTLWMPYEVGGLRFFRGFGEELPEFYLPRQLKRNHLDWVRERIWEAQLKFGVRAVIVDHLHFLFDMTRSRNPSLEIGAIMRNLVGMAQEFNVCFFLIAHMIKTTADKEPERGDIRDSSFIEQECDNTLAVWRSKKNGSTNAKLKIIHNRRNGVFDKIVELHKVGPYLRELEDKREDENIPELPKQREWWEKQVGRSDLDLAEIGGHE